MSYDKRILSIDNDDDNKDYQAFDEFLQDDTKRQKNAMSLEIEQFGSQYLKEIDRKKRNKELKKSKLIPYILLHSNGVYDEEELNSYSFEDVQTIYNQIRKENRSIVSKILHFIFNID